MNKYLIISPAPGMKAEELQPFIKSLKKCHIKADVVFLRLPKDGPIDFGESDENLNFSYYKPRSLSVQLFLSRLFGAGKITRIIGFFARKLGKAGEKISPFIMHIHLSRHFHARDILRKSTTKYSHIAMIDTRDLIFQKDPFEGIPINQLVVAEEDYRIKDEPHNLYWITFLNRRFAENRLNVEETVICAGSIIGGYGGFMSYSNEMCKHCNDVGDLVGCTGGFDQGILNIVLRQKKNTFVKVQPSGVGPICHIGVKWEDLYILDEELGMLDKDHNIIPIVHQFDRRLKLVDFFSKFLDAKCYAHPHAS